LTAVPEVYVGAARGESGAILCGVVQVDHISETPRDRRDVARWARIENGVREDAARLAKLVLEGKADAPEAQGLARRIDSVRTQGIGADY
jgi:hypothetical protein